MYSKKTSRLKSQERDDLIFNSSACRTLDQLHRFQQQLLARHTAKLSWDKPPVVAFQIHRRTNQRFQLPHIMLTFRNFSKFFSEFLFSFWFSFQFIFVFFVLKTRFCLLLSFSFLYFQYAGNFKTKKRPEKFRPDLKIKVKMMSCFLSCLSVLRRCMPSQS